MERLTLHNLTSAFDYAQSHLSQEDAAKVYSRLAEIEDKLESGLALELLCKVGDEVYQTDTDCTRIYASTVKRIIFDGRIIYDTDTIAFDEQAVGKSIFLKRSDAEARLK